MQAKLIGQIGVGLKTDPNLAKQSFYSLGKTYEQLADFEHALKAYRQAVDADPMWMPAREAVAATLQSLGRSNEASEERRTLGKSQDASLGTRVAFDPRSRLRRYLNSVPTNAIGAKWTNCSISWPSRPPNRQPCRCSGRSC